MRHRQTSIRLKDTESISGRQQQKPPADAAESKHTALCTCVPLALAASKPPIRCAACTRVQQAPPPRDHVLLEKVRCCKPPHVALLQANPKTLCCSRVPTSGLRTFFRMLSQKFAINSALVLPATFLLQKPSKASLSALWNRLLLAKQVPTYARYLSCSAMTWAERQAGRHRYRHTSMYVFIHRRDTC